MSIFAAQLCELILLPVWSSMVSRIAAGIHYRFDVDEGEGE